jgi:hypothetical protein
MTTTAQIREVILSYYDKNRKRARGDGLTRHEIVEAVVKKYRVANVLRVRARLNNLKAQWIDAEVIEPGKRGLWVFARCPHPCDLCFKMCRYTGEHYDRHRCLNPHR